MILLCVSVVLVFIFVWQKKSESKRNVSYRKVPSPDAYPLFGNSHLLVGVSALFKAWDIAKKYSTPFIINIGSHRTVFVDKPEDIHKLVLCPKLECYAVVPFNSGLITQRDNSVWKPQRNFILPLFSTHVINSIIPIFNKHSRILVSKFEEKVNCDEFNIKETIGLNIMRQNVESLFGVALEPGEDERLWKEIENAFDKGSLHIMLYHFTKPITRHTRLANFLSRPTKYITQFSKRILASRREQLKDENLQDSQLISTSFLDRIIQMKHNSSIKDVNEIDHLAQILAAAVDTTTVTISNIVLLLAMHPEVQEKCLVEIRSAIMDEAEDIDHEIMTRMPYLTMVIKECMRIIPTVPYIGKHVDRDIQLENFDLPAGSEVAVVFFTQCRNKEIWGEDADKFNPDHFLPEVEAKRHKYAYVPFSFGPRVCIGAKYAMYNLKIVIIHLLLNFKFLTSVKLEDLVIYATLSTSFTPGHMVRFERRT